MAWPLAAGCSVAHYPSSMYGWSYDDSYFLEDKTLNVQFPALKALAFKDISNDGASYLNEKRNKCLNLAQVLILDSTYHFPNNPS